MGRKAVFRVFSRGGGHGIMKKTIPGGACHAEGQMESEHRLHIGAAAGEPAADLPLRPDDCGGPDGLREDHGGELVSRASARGRRRCASSASACTPTTSPSSGEACRTPLPARGLRFCGTIPARRTRPAAACSRTTSATSWRGTCPAICFIDDFHLLTDGRVAGVSLHARKPPAGERAPDRRQP